MQINHQGPLTESVYYILLSLQDQKHGYAIMQDIKALTNNRVDISAGTLYGALTTLIDKGWIVPVESEEDTRKKDYCLTELGHNFLETEITRLEELVKNGHIMLHKDSHE